MGGPISISVTSISVTSEALRRTIATVVATATSRTRTIPVVSLDLDVSLDLGVDLDPGVSLDPGVGLGVGVGPEFIRAAARYRCGLVALLS